MYTPIHRALDLEPGDLTYEMVEQAVRQGVRESEDLDWKRVPPPTETGKAWKEEFAKDIAAMANTGGGWIVYGVEDDRTTSAAVRIHPFQAADDGLERQLRGSAYGGVQPPVRGLRFHPVVRQGSNDGVLALQVLPSNDMPHLLPLHDGFKVPFRYGAKTEWMGERAIELAYRERFRSRTSLEDRLHRLYDERMRPVSQYQNILRASSRPMFVAVAVPDLPDAGAQPSPRSATAALMAAEDLFAEALDRQVPVASPLSVRRGLRRYVTVGQEPNEPTVELHFDGSVSLVEPLRWADEGMPGVLAGYDIERAVARFVSTVGARARADASSGSYAIRAGVVWFGASLLLASMRAGQLEQVTPPPPIGELVPVDASLRGAATVDELREEMRDLARDLLNQGGLDRLDLIPPR